ncbi:MAG: response regulator transcription factor [Gammaproteobacteria bacterium]|jgi:RNA polymerase sigma factor (sigma-70 family)
MQSDAIVYIVDDDEPIRKSLSLLMKSGGYRPVPCASAQEFLDRFDSQSPGCVVLDVRMPGMSGLELQQLLTDRGSPVPVIIMTGHGDVGMAVRAMKAGARDFIEKPFDNQVLLDRIEEALADAEQQQRRDEELGAARARLDLLTPRERQTMELLVSGKLNKQVAADLNISVRTVESHRAKIMDKLQVRSLSELVRLSLTVH